MTGTHTNKALPTLAALGAAGVGVAVWATTIERFWFTLRQHDLAVLPAGSPTLKVLHVSDLHMAPWQHRKQDWVAQLAETVQPDFIVNTGDNLGHADGLYGVRRALAPFRGVPGVFVHGSNDIHAPSARNPFRYFMGPSEHTGEADRLDTEAMDSFFTDELGWQDLNNAVADVDVRGLSIRTFGVDDAHRDWDDLDAVADALKSDPGTPDFTIGVTHAPYRRVLDQFVTDGADILFAGHTHGGQVRIPFSPKAIVANCDIPLDQARGLSEWSAGGRTVPLNVSAGLGHSIYAPIRFACLPEASVLTLRAVS